MLKKIINLGIYLTVFSLPLYLVRFSIWWIPTNLLEVIICFLFILWLFKREEKTIKCEFILPLLLIFIGLTVSSLFSKDILVSAGIWKSWFIIPLIFSYLVLKEIKTKKEIRNVFISLSLSGLIVSFISLFYLLSGRLTYDSRLSAFFLSPNHLAMYLSPIFVLSLYLYFVFRKNLCRILLLIVQLLSLFIIYFTYSLAACLAIFISLFFLLLYRKSRVFTYSILFLLIILLIIQIPSKKFQNLIDFSYPSLKSRLVIWQSAWRITKDHALIGIGPGMFQEYYLAYQKFFPPYPEWAVPQPHNIFLAFWLQTGLLGLMGFIRLIYLFFRKCFKNIGSPLFLILSSVMIYTLVHGLFDTPFWKNDLALLFFLVIALGCIGDRLSYSRKGDNLPED